MKAMTKILGALAVAGGLIGSAQVADALFDDATQTTFGSTRITVNNADADVQLSTSGGGVQIQNATGLYTSHGQLTCNGGGISSQTRNGTPLLLDGHIALFCGLFDVGVEMYGSLTDR